MPLKWISGLWSIRGRVRLTWSLLKDDRIPVWQKAIPFLPLIYIFSPLNFLTLAIPLVGQLDDILLVIYAMELMERTVDKTILDEYKAK